MTDQLLMYQGTCTVCKTPFESARKRKTCSRKCATSLSWQNPKAKARRIASISKSHKTPEALARTAEQNRQRWAKPEEHERASVKSRARWADPAMAKKMREAIKRTWQKPELREKMRQIRLKDWADPEYRAKMAKGVEAYFSNPENRALFSVRLRKRWADPVKRQKMIFGIIRFSRDPAYRAACAARFASYWNREGELERRRQWLKDPEKVRERSRKIWETRRANLCRKSHFAKDVYALMPTLRGAAYKAGCRGDNIEDMCQWAIMKAIESQEQFKAGSNLKAWVCTILRNGYMSEVRKFWRQTELDPEFDQIDDTANNAESSAELADVVALIRGLSEEKRLALMLIAGGASYEEAAEKLDVAVGTIKSRVARARDELREATIDKNRLPAAGKAREEALAEIAKAAA